MTATKPELSSAQTDHRSTAAAKINGARAARIGALLIGAVALCIFPYTASQFWVVGIAIKSMWLGTIALSLVFLTAYVGMVSLAQVAVAGVSGYIVANLTVEQGWGPWPSVALAIGAAVLFSIIAAVVAARSNGIYFLMITLAIAVLVYYAALQYRPFTNGFSGINGVGAPDLAGISLSTPTHFYFLTLLVAVGAYLLVRAVAGSPFGLTLQGIRDGQSRMSALGYRVTLHRIVAFAFAGFIAGVGGVISVWYNGQISPGSIDLTRTINILVIAVIGGLYKLHGAWIGAVAITLLDTYADQVTDHVNTLIGVVFIVILLISPGGLVGAADLARTRLSRRSRPSRSR